LTCTRCVDMTELLYFMGVLSCWLRSHGRWGVDDVCDCRA
jgi:hypothetical protein